MKGLRIVYVASHTIRDDWCEVEPSIFCSCLTASQLAANSPTSDLPPIFTRHCSTAELRAVGRCHHPTNQLTDFSRKVAWRSQLMARRLVDSSQASEASQISPPRPSGIRPKIRTSMYPAFNGSFLLRTKYGHPVGSSGKRLIVTTSPTIGSNYLVRSM